MERLGFGAGSKYDALEASHHLARYRFVKELCPGKRVLDAACGEGYGSRLMALWGASYVEGVDISAEAIESARRNFAAENIRFAVGDCERLNDTISPEPFDLVVSFETLEHVDDVHSYLESLKLACRPGGSIVISCPNDHWTYKLGGSNEFHKRRFTFEEFKETTTKILGAARSWHKSTLAIGYSINSEELDLPEGGASSPQELMFDYRPIDAGLFVPTQKESSATNDELAFYVGVWGENSAVPALFSGYPVSMELTRQALFPAEGIWAVKPNPEVAAWEAAEEARKEAELEGTRAQLEDEVKLARISLQRANNELTISNSLLDEAKNELELISAEADQLRIDMRQKDIEIESASLRAKVFATEAELLLRSVNHRDWIISNLTIERDLLSQERNTLSQERDELSQERDALSQERDVATDAIRRVPWRIVGIWRRVRKLVPTPLLKAVGKVWKIR